MKEQHPAEPHYLTCERNWVYFTLIAVAGFWGAYTYLLRGNVFCNAQTGNVVLMGLALGSAEWAKAGYYLVPISAYILGAFVSELLPNPIKHRFNVRWDTVLMLIEMIAVLGLGFLPETAPVQICTGAVSGRNPSPSTAIISISISTVSHRTLNRCLIGLGSSSDTNAPRM